MGETRVLLTTCPVPYPEHPPHRDGIDQYGMRFTKHQGLFQIPIAYPFHLGLHLLARNLDAQVTVLDGPSPAQLAWELARQPDLVGITFPVVLLPQALATAQLVRRWAPRARIALGGHGVTCLAGCQTQATKPWQTPPQVAPGSLAEEQMTALNQLADVICLGDGIPCLRREIGQSLDDPVSGVLPPSGVMRPFGLPLIPLRNMISLTPALGCSGGCDFCSTGAFFGGRRRPVLSPKAALEAVRAQLSQVPAGQRALGVILDEDLLADSGWMRPFGLALAQDPLVRRTGFTCTVFGSFRSLVQYDIEELVRWRISNIWLGVETTLPPQDTPYLQRKRQGPGGQGGRTADPQETFARLHRAGITTTASFILGWDFHDPQSIRQDMEAFLRLQPTMAQVLPLIPAPATRLWQAMSREQRLAPISRWEDYHYYGRGFSYRHFSVDALWQLEDEVETRLYQEQGPSFLKMAQVYLQGWQRFSPSTDPALADMGRIFGELVQELRPVLDAVVRFGPNPAIQEAARATAQRAQKCFGSPSWTHRLQSQALGGWGALKSKSLLGRRPTQPESHRTVYHRGQQVEADW